MFKKKERENINYEQVDTIVGSGSEFQGTLLARGTLRVDGRVNGEIQVEGDLIVGEKGQVAANIKARHVTIAGQVAGDVELEGTLELTATGRLHGDITVANLIIAEGATFEGACKMQPAPESRKKPQSQKADG